MPSPFPGMNPYLEDSEIWPGFHHFLADEIAAQLNPRIGPRYYADVEVRTVADTVSIANMHTIYPDAGVFERLPPQPAGHFATPTMTIPEAPVKRIVLTSGQTRLRAVRVYVTDSSQLVTSIEILSPFNKRRGEGLEEYRRKRERLLRSPVHLVELDLLRGGLRPGREVNEPELDTDYVLLVSRDQGDEARLSEIWPVALNEPLPLLPLPLMPPDPDVILDLGAALQVVYGRAGYEWRLDYQRPVPPPALRPAMVAWLQAARPDIGPSGSHTRG
ncbi:MAG: DUF4058 family protein [Chloroflexota bacterium]